MRPVTIFFTLFFIIQWGYTQTTVLHCGKLLDVLEGRVLEKMSVVIKNHKITAVQSGYITLESATIIDLKNKTVMPGLMDMHVHMEGEMDKHSYLEKFTKNPADIAFESVGFANKTLMTGFTTVRDLGGTGVNIALRNAINAEKIIGPRIFTAGKALSITGGHADPTNGFRADLMGNPGPESGVVNSDSDGRKAVRQQYKNGADLIKVTATGGVLSVAKDGSGPHFSEFEMTIIVDAALDLNMKVAAHAHGDEGIQRAIRAGVASIEHGTLMSDQTMDLMVTNGTWYVPTITAGKAVGDSAKIDGYYPEIVAEKAIKIGPKIQSTFERAYKKGVKIAFGTDAGVFGHGQNMMEFVYMTEVGMPVMEAIKSATINGAKLIGNDDKLGSISVGKFADIIATDENPINNVKALFNVSFVMKNGKIYKQ